jgi:large subunit ribosomal protein L9e
MKTILASQTMDLPEGVKIEIKAKQIRVTGPRGVLTRNFKHLNLDFQMLEGGRKLKVEAWFGTRKTMAAIRTAISHINNLITGVSKGYRYKMRFVYAHFPINASITAENDNIEIRNFLGEKRVSSLIPCALTVSRLFQSFCTGYTYRLETLISRSMVY